MDEIASEVAPLINSFNIPGWTNCPLEQIVVRPLGDGWINSTYKVERTTKTSSEEKAPVLVYKKYGGNKFAEAAETTFALNSPLVHSLICYELSKHGWGPKLFGCFDGGRLEEYIDCDTLHPSEAFTEEVSADVARALARFHSLDLPLDRSTVNFLDTAKNSFDRGRNDLIKWLDSGVASEECSGEFAFLLTFPSDAEYKWLSSTVEKIHHRKVFSTLDPNFLNRLVRNDRNENRCVVIDFDVSCYYNRGYDLGGHFVARLISSGCKENKSSGYPYPTREERLFFLIKYLDEFCKLCDDFDPQTIDNLEHLELEADVHAMVYALWLILMCSTFNAMYQVEPNLYTLIRPMVEIYYKLKDQFCETYSHLV